MKDSAKEKCVYVILPIFAIAVIVFGAIHASRAGEQGQARLTAADQLVRARQSCSYAEELTSRTRKPSHDRAYLLQHLIVVCRLALADSRDLHAEPIATSPDVLTHARRLLLRAEAEARPLDPTPDEIAAAKSNLHEILQQYIADHQPDSLADSPAVDLSPAPDPADAGLRYCADAGELMSRVERASMSIANAIGSKATPQDLTADDIRQIESACQELQVIAGEVRQLTPPNKALRRTHARLLDAMDDQDYAASRLPRALSSGDGPVINRCVQRELEASGHIREATIEIATYSASRR